MNKLTKLGVSALCGSLASISLAQAGEYSVTGGVTVSHRTNDSDETTGNPLGMSRNMSLNASGELDNGYTWSYFAATNDLNDSGFNMTSAGFSMTMDTLGTIELRQKASPIGALDDITPNAYEESWDGLTGTGNQDFISGVGGGGATHIAYTSPADILPLGTSIQLAYAPHEIGGDATPDKGSASDADVEGSGWEAVIKMAPVDGLTIGAGYMQADAQTTAMEDDHKEGLYYATYAVGSVKVHWQQNYEDPSAIPTASAGVEYYDTQAYGISFQVNDDLSISYTTNENKAVYNDSADVSQDYTGIGAAYNLGGATLKISHNKVDNQGWSTGSTGDDERTVIALGLAF